MRRRRERTNVQKVAGKFHYRRRAALLCLRKIWTVYDNAQGAGKPQGARSLGPPPGRWAAEQARRGEARESSACEASAARVPAPRPIPRMW